VTAQPIAPVIPSPGRLADRPRFGPSAVRPLPMAGPTAALSVPADVVYGTGRIDASGRVADQAVSCALGWREGDRLTVTSSPGVVTARRDPGGLSGYGLLASPSFDTSDERTRRSVGGSRRAR
jgi:hypothetical protein